MNLFRAAIAPLAGGRPFFSEVIVTGSHAASLEAVADGNAPGLAAIDCVTFGSACGVFGPGPSSASPSSPKARPRPACRSS